MEHLKKNRKHYKNELAERENVTVENMHKLTKAMNKKSEWDVYYLLTGWTLKKQDKAK